MAVARASIGFVLLAEGDAALGSRFAALLSHAKGVSSVFEAVDGADVVQARRRLRPEPPLSGVEAAATSQRSHALRTPE
jgi:hypothetical protein